jgi:hypothetical protein
MSQVHSVTYVPLHADAVTLDIAGVRSLSVTATSFARFLSFLLQPELPLFGQDAYGCGRSKTSKISSAREVLAFLEVVDPDGIGSPGPNH